MTFGIPTLSAERQDRLEEFQKVGVWRATKKKGVDCWLFYIDDYRFDSLWTNPDKILSTGASNAVELNYSVFEDSPEALAIWNIYRKRYASKTWQDAGIKVWADLCFPKRWEYLALEGIPKGWQRYATRGFEERVGDLEREWTWARNHADGNAFKLLVYGGGKKVKRWVEGRNSVVYVPHYSSGRVRPGEGTRRRLKQQSLRPTGTAPIIGHT